MSKNADEELLSLKQNADRLLAKDEKLQEFLTWYSYKSLYNTWQGIEKTPGVCGGDARIAGTRIPVWGLVNARRLGINEAQLLDDYPHLSAGDLVNAWADADAYPDEIEEAIRRNEEA